MADKESPLSAMLKGSTAGLAGTVVLTGAIKYAPELLNMAGVDAPPPPAAGDKAHPPEHLAQKAAKGLFNTRLNKGEKQAAGQAIHWSYGVGWGALYGILQGTFRLPWLVSGTLLGVAMTIAASTMLPAMGVAPPANKVPTSQKIMQASFIMMYGWTTALVYHLLSGDDRAGT